ncbi:hypothetical protein ACO2RV_18625 [Ancylobacter sp. VNQ12]|uniref:hypothetical protein n=1 Tax=Ancylobacter sp. VNQ12 TaxID=3400920 RepID=UPI003C07D807
MAVSAGSLYVDLGLSAATFQTGLQRAGKQLDTFGSKAQRVGGVARVALAGVGDGLKLALAGFTVGGALAGLRAATSDLAQLNAEAKRAGLSAEQLQELGFAAKQSRVGIDALVDGVKELQLRADEFIVTGQGSAAEAFARLGYSADELQKKLANPADLFEEVIDKLARLDKAAQIRIADELFGGTGGEQFVQLLDRGVGSVGKLRAEARLTGNVISQELVDRAVELDRQFNAIAQTVGQNLRGAVVSVVNAFAPFADMLNQIENQSNSTLQKRIDLLRAAAENMRKSSLAFAAGGGDAGIAQREAEAEQLEALLSSRPGTSITVSPAPGSAPVPASAKKGSSTSSASSKTTYADLIAVANERIQQLQVEQQALYLTADASEALRLKEEILAYAKRENISLSPQELADLESKADLYGKLSVEVAKAAEAQAEINGLGRDVVGGIVGDLRQGVDAAQAFANALDRVADRLINMALDSLFPSGGGGGGAADLLGSFFSGIFGGSKAVGGPVNAGHAYRVGERGPEMFVPDVAGRIVPNHLSAGAGAGSTTVPISITIDARGADEAGLARVQQQLVQLRRDVPAMAARSVQDARKRNVKI